MANTFIKKLFFIFLATGSVACTTLPAYQKPELNLPAQYKENKFNKNWQTAKPNDAYQRGQWWQVFNDAELNKLEEKLNQSNPNIAVATARYQQALATVDEARANYFPTITASATIQRQRQNSNFSTVNQRITNSHSTILNASWEPDIWGKVSSAVAANKAGAQASAVELAVTQLSAQATLAQFYFELRALDTTQALLNKTINDNKKLVQLTQNRYQAGVAQRLDVVQAQTQVESVQAQSLRNQSTRAQYEHAIAVLIGEAPANFNLTATSLKISSPTIPVGIPSSLLERRPDVAQAERLMAQANAEIGIANAAYFPDLTLTGSVGLQRIGGSLAQLISAPYLIWGLGPELVGTLFDGGVRSAKLAAANANYKASIASYRLTVLNALQEVEDNLVALRLLNDEASVQMQAANNAKLALKLTLNQYKAGIVAYANVITAQTNAYTAEKNLSDVNGLRMSTAVALIKALGGSWQSNYL